MVAWSFGDAFVARRAFLVGHIARRSEVLRSNTFGFVLKKHASGSCIACIVCSPTSCRGESSAFIFLVDICALRELLFVECRLSLRNGCDAVLRDANVDVASLRELCMAREVVVAVNVGHLIMACWMRVYVL